MAQLTSLSNSTTMQTPRPPVPDSLQGKMDETFHALNRSRSLANLILQHIDGPQLTGQADAQKSVPARHMQGDAADAFHVAHEVEDLLIRIQNTLGINT